MLSPLFICIVLAAGSNPRVYWDTYTLGHTTKVKSQQKCAEKQTDPDSPFQIA